MNVYPKPKPLTEDQIKKIELIFERVALYALGDAKLVSLMWDISMRSRTISTPRTLAAGLCLLVSEVKQARLREKMGVVPGTVRSAKLRLPEILRDDENLRTVAEKVAGELGLVLPPPLPPASLDIDLDAVRSDAPRDHAGERVDAVFELMVELSSFNREELIPRPGRPDPERIAVYRTAMALAVVAVSAEGVVKPYSRAAGFVARRIRVRPNTVLAALTAMPELLRTRSDVREYVRYFRAHNLKLPDAWEKLLEEE